MTLTRIPSPAAWPLLRQLRGRDPLGRGAAVKSRASEGLRPRTVEAVASLKSSDPSFYRVVKNYRSGLAELESLNDAEAQGYYGVSSYGRFNPVPVELLADVLEDRRSTGDARRAALDQLALLGPRACAAIPVLLQVLKEPQQPDGPDVESLRSAAAWALRDPAAGRCGGADTV